MENIKVKVGKEVETLIIRNGEALPLKEPNKIQINGQIDAIVRFLSKRTAQSTEEDANNPSDIAEVVDKNCHILVDRSNLKMELLVDEKNFYGSEITGALLMNPEFLEWGINTNTTRSPKELAAFIKMNRYFFSDRMKAMSLVTELTNFKAKIDKEIEKTDDFRGNKRELLDQKINSNLPESFDIEIPIFKGQSKQTINVEILITGDNFQCYLQSPDTIDLIRETRDTIIDEQIKKIEELAPGIAIIEI
jgi:hypothetical protein